MSRAFTREEDSENAIAGIGERPVSEHRNLVTENGLAMIDAALGALREELGAAEREGNRERIALVSRDLRYWASRRETAELSVPEADSDVVRFGMRVTIEDEDGNARTWKIVGEDEADLKQGLINVSSPIARALIGKEEGDTAVVQAPGGEKRYEIVTVSYQ